MKKIKQSLVIIAALFFGGNLLVFIGLAKGNDIADYLSRPAGAMSWTTTGEMMSGCTYAPVIMGISLILLSLILSIIVFVKWFSD